MSHDNAPATKLLATNCACCGRALVDAKSVEAGIGPDCRERYGVDVDVTEPAREEANAIVFRLARRGVTREDARPMFDRLAALGFVVLADRVAKRFRAEVTKVDVPALRAEYARIRAHMCYDSCTLTQFNRHVLEMLGEAAGFRKGDVVHLQAGPADYVAAAKRVEVKCGACGGSGVYHGHHDGGECYRCSGKGFQNADDVARNRGYDAIRSKRAS